MFKTYLLILILWNTAQGRYTMTGLDPSYLGFQTCQKPFQTGQFFFKFKSKSSTSLVFLVFFNDPSTSIAGVMSKNRLNLIVSSSTSLKYITCPGIVKAHHWNLINISVSWVMVNGKMCGEENADDNCDLETFYQKNIKSVENMYFFDENKTIATKNFLFKYSNVTIKYIFLGGFPLNFNQQHDQPNHNQHYPLFPNLPPSKTNDHTFNHSANLSPTYHSLYDTSSNFPSTFFHLHFAKSNIMSFYVPLSGSIVNITSNLCHPRSMVSF